MTMTGFFAIQYWIIFFLMVGLCCNRPFVSRLAFSAVTFAIGRFFIRSVIIWVGGPSNPIGEVIGADLFILCVNFGVLAILLWELVSGHRDKFKKKKMFIKPAGK